MSKLQRLSCPLPLRQSHEFGEVDFVVIASFVFFYCVPLIILCIGRRNASIIFSPKEQPAPESWLCEISLHDF
jgi:hypothetical protein